MTYSGNIGQFVTPSELGYTQLKTESWGRAGKRFYAHTASSLDAIRQQWDRIITNGQEGGRAFVTLYGESLSLDHNSPQDAAREQATWDALQAELTQRSVPVNTVRMGTMTAANYMAMLRSIYFELEVGAKMHSKGNITSTGQPAVTLAKKIAQSTNAVVNKAIIDEGADTLAKIEERRATYIREKGVPAIKHTDIERNMEKPFDLEQSMPNIEPEVRQFLDNFLRSNGPDVPGLATKNARTKWQRTPKHEMIGWLRGQIQSFVGQNSNVGP